MVSIISMIVVGSETYDVLRAKSRLSAGQENWSVDLRPGPRPDCNLTSALVHPVAFTTQAKTFSIRVLFQATYAIAHKAHA